MNEQRVKKIDFMNLAPYVRYIHEHNSQAESNGRPSPGYRVPPRVIYDYELIYVTKGGCLYNIEGVEYLLRPGDLHFMRPHVKHHCYDPDGNTFQYYAVHFDLAYMGEPLDFDPGVYTDVDYSHIDHVPVNEKLVERPVIELAEIDFPYVIHSSEPQFYLPLYRELLTVFQTKPYGGHLIMRAIMLRILHQMVKDMSTKEGVKKSHPQGEKAIEAIQYMYGHMHEDIEINDIAQSVFLSPNYFRTLFKQATGKTPLEYLTMLRIDRAKLLMVEGKYTINEISGMVGYQDRHHFSKVFKKAEGLPPRKYLISLPNSDGGD
ncbi:AraC family transcriptional regulator [Paenibacillus baekrokdamisoli]|uniref:AraC family transcriptional regulator n=1 Tax=Paenibacillus baekrokdamisoli TaxID=1712516 RepID=A0A3G9JB25_9BACL|nr:AraC family transcriptional regulator [Paenibacillus baekrokdamisoli]MBB3070948.1 AraC-like DNA-binding protein [Paenibacillus baekrokdamisoli]BBH22113.1 AraC family transcriptional regulator [Paenibacillus baekrokdamisoli]